MLVVPTYLSRHLTHPVLVAHFERFADMEGPRYISISREQIDDALVEDVAQAADAAGDRPYIAAIEQLIDARQGRFRQIKSGVVATEILYEYISRDTVNGWLYEKEVVEDGEVRYQPWLVGDERVLAWSGDHSIRLHSYALNAVEQRGWTRERTIPLNLFEGFRPGRPETVLRRLGFCKETEELYAQYVSDREHALEIARMGRRATLNGVATYGSLTETTQISHRSRPVIVDSTIDPEVRELIDGSETDSMHQRELVRYPSEPGAPYPLFLQIGVYDPTSAMAAAVDSRDLTLHEYDSSVAERIIMPSSHRRLIDILTTDMDRHAADVIEGRSAGMAILCKGQPGVGKTLTAHVYAEVMERPLYPVNLSQLADGGSNVRKVLEKAFTRARRWNAVLLLDEADVILGRRGENMARNRLTAEMLVALEHYEGLVFLTTNRPHDIDEAVLSRCAAIIEYKAPVGDDARRVWRTLASVIDVEISDGTIEAAVKVFPELAPRDVRALLRLAGRLADDTDAEVSIDTLREASVFRGITPKELS